MQLPHIRQANQQEIGFIFPELSHLSHKGRTPQIRRLKPYTVRLAWSVATVAPSQNPIKSENIHFSLYAWKQRKL